MGSQGTSSVPHVVAIPFFLPGHITPLLHLCRYLASSGCLVTLLKIPDDPSKIGAEIWDNGVRVLSALPLAPTKVPPAVRGDDHGRELLETAASFDAFQALNDFNSVTAIVEELAASTGAPITCVISDVYVGWARDVASALKVRWIALWTSTVAELVVYSNMPRLIARGVFPFVGDPNDKTFSIPGLPELRPQDYPSFGLIPEQVLHRVLHTFKELVQRIIEADRVLVNSIYSIEGPAIDSLRSTGPNIQSVGPLHLLPEKLGTANHKEKDEIIKWLDKQPSSSVLYIAFGTTMPMAKGQFEELAWALEESGQKFVWAVREDVAASLIPAGFHERMADRDQGLVVPWAPQLEILAHASTGGFLTHCGWNSVLESMSNGMPVVARPISGDQVLTKKFLVDVWRIGVGVKGIEIGREVANRESLKEAFRELMDDDRKSSEVWRNASCIEKVIRKAVEEKGSSKNNLDCLVHDLHLWHGRK